MRAAGVLRGCAIAVTAAAVTAACLLGAAEAEERRLWAETQAAFDEVVEMSTGEPLDASEVRAGVDYFVPRRETWEEGESVAWRRDIRRTEVQRAGKCVVMLFDYKIVTERSDGPIVVNVEHDIPVVFSQWEDGTWHVVNVLVQP